MFQFKKKIAGVTAALVAAAMLVQPAAVMAANTKPYVALGADLNSDQRAEVLSWRTARAESRSRRTTSRM